MPIDENVQRAIEKCSPTRAVFQHYESDGSEDHCKQKCFDVKERPNHRKNGNYEKPVHMLATEPSFSR